MARLTIKQVGDLGPLFVLAPERYDPRRESLRAQQTVPLGSIASSIRETLHPRADTCSRYIVLDTSDVREGIVAGRKTAVRLSGVGSAKKKLQRQDVLISRLRPYLRQVAFIDAEVFSDQPDAGLACSTEFFVLRSATPESIAFLVPFLLSEPVQQVLSASQEGGHHPRFSEETLLTLPVPQTLLAKRADDSAEVIRAIASYRQAERTLLQLVEAAERTVQP